MKVFANATMNSRWDLVGQFVRREVLENETKDYKRVKGSLRIDPNPIQLPKDLKNDDLKKMAGFVNHAVVHYSGNCVLLAACVHYNIEKNAKILCAGNISSPRVGLEPEVVDKVIFGKELNRSSFLNTLDEVSKEVLRRYEVYGDRSCIVSAESYSVPLFGETWHDFNAVVLLDSSNKPFVQYLDAWKTSSTLPEKEALQAHFPVSACFIVRSYRESGGAGK